MSLNKAILVGRLVKDPELRYSPSGTGVVRFTLAVNRVFKREGEQDADFIGCVAFGKTAESLANYQKKGNLIGVDGRIQTGSYEKDGVRIYTTDVVADSIQFLEPRNANGEGGQVPQSNQQQGNYQHQQNAPQQQYQQNQQQPQQRQQATPQQQNYSRVDEDPFANSKGPIAVSEDDLPF